MQLGRLPLVLAVVVAGALSTSRAAMAGPPTDSLKSGIDRVIAVLEDAGLKDRPQERRAALRRVTGTIFDVEEAAQRSLARHWQARTPAERGEFVQLFGRLLEAAYLTKIELYSGEKVFYGGDTIDGDHATVRTRVVTREGTEIPVDYRMLKRDDTWLVYDVSIEGVSLISNYRTQFNRIIQMSSFQDLVKKLRARQDEPVVSAKPVS
jgi:phospholipid transport system substrate-binding protein